MKKAILSLLVISIASLSSIAQTVHLTENFNGASLPTGWTTTAVSGTHTWTFALDGTSDEGGINNLDGTGMAIFDDGSHGGGSLNDFARLITPVFNNSGFGATYLDFDYNFREELAVPNDSFYVEVFDGTNWQNVFSRKANDCGGYSNPLCNTIPHATINISAFSNANCQVRFVYFDGNDYAWYVNIDNVVVSSPVPDDIGVTSILRPNSGCGLSATDTVEVQIANTGSNPASNFNVAYTINGGAPVSELVSSTLLAGTTMNYKFVTTANLSVIGLYDIEVYTILAADGDNSNDTAKNTVQNEPSFSPTYNEDFENANHLWTVSGVNSSWQRGFPQGTKINVAASGNNAFVTNRTGPYNNLEVSFLTSPCLDFSASIGDPIMSFSLYRDMEDGYDRVWMESSIDNGVTWSKIPGSANPTNWYNNNTLQVWTGQRNGWFPVENILTGLGGQSQVKLRFSFVSDGSTTLEGVGVDNFSIRDPQLFDISMNALDYPIASGTPECGYGIEFITVELENKGANVLNNFDVGFVVDGGVPVIETITTPLASNAIMTYTFTQSYDFTIVKNYSVSVFATAAGDGFQPNDSIFRLVNNSSIGSVPITYIQNFDGFTSGVVTRSTDDAINGGWTRTPEGGNDYSWRVRNTNVGVGSTGTGPIADHTTGTGNYMYTESSNGAAGDEAMLTSPCIDLSGRLGAKMSFYYHRYGAQMPTFLFIDVYDGAQWHLAEDQVGGATFASDASPFLEKEVDLNGYAGKKIKVRFRTIRRGCCTGDLAIDDIRIWEPIPQDAAVKSGSTTGTTVCGNSPATISINIDNVGTQPIAPNTMSVSYKTFNGSPVTELVPTNIPVGGSLNYTFTQQLNSTNSGSQVVYAWTSLPGDSNTDNDRIRFSYYSGGVSLPLYVMDFEGHTTTNLQGFTRSNGAFRWEVQEGQAPAAIPPPGSMDVPTGPSGDHTLGDSFQNGRGKYMIVKTNINPANYADATLTLPCIPIDFSNSENRSVALTFWYHIYGNFTADLYVDVFDGTTWLQGIGVIRGQGRVGQKDAQTAATDNWHEAFVNLDQFARPTSNNLRIRFRAEYGRDPVSGNPAAGGDIAIDDILIIDRILNDVSTKDFLELESDCALNSNEEIKVDVQNIGTQDIIKLNMNYQVKFTPSPYGANAGNTPTVFDVVKDSAVGILIIPDARLEFAFDTRVDMTEPGTYDFTIWSAVPGDTNTFNDTLKHRIKNETRPGISCENWSELNSGDIPNKFLDEKLPNDWVGTDGNYAFKAIIGATTDGPLSGHTGNQNDIYMASVNDDGDPGGIAQIESPCFDLTNTASVNLEFWYWTEGAGVPLLVVDVRPSQNGAWELGVDSIFGPETGEWTPHRVVMTEYAGDFVNIRFRSFSPPGSAVTPGVYAIDDICMVVPPPQQIELERILSPREGLCFYSDSEYVRIRAQNIGSDRIDSFQVVIAVDTASIQAVKGSSYFRDTVWVVIDKPPFFNAGEKFDFRIDNLPLDMTYKGDYFISVFLILNGDLDPNDQFIVDFPIVHQVPDLLIFNEDFEGLGVNEGGPEYSNRWIRSSGDYEWRLKRGMDVRNVTGPAVDHTKGTTLGKYMVTDASADQAVFGSVGTYETPCIDFTQAKNPVIRYWYHMFGGDMGNLFLEVNDDSGWEAVDSIKGQVQGRNQDAWEESPIINLKKYAGKFVKVRFKAINGPLPSIASDMAIDDILIYDLEPKDLSPIKLVRPNGSITSCYTDTQSVYVTLRNFGSDSIDFEVDTTDIVINIFKNNVAHATMVSKLNYNVWKTPNGVIRPLPQDSLVTVRIDGSFDMSVIGDEYRFEIETFMHNDSGALNNVLLDTIVTRMEGGEALLLTTSVEVCKGTGIKLQVNNYFGRLRWEERLEVANGFGVWRPGFNFPFDSARYIGYPDTSAWYRVKVCDRIYSDSVKANVVAVRAPRGLRDSVCGEGMLTLGAGTAPTVDSVYVYKEIDDLVPYKTLNTLPFQFSEYFTETDTFYLEGIIHDSCYSDFRTPVYAVVNEFPEPNLGIPTGEIDSICELTDTLRVFSGGAVDGRLFTYNWTITGVGGAVSIDSTASILFDTRELEKKTIYSVSVVTVSDSGCMVSRGPVSFVVFDSCIIGLNEEEIANKLKVYPNPTNGLLTVGLESYSGINADVELQSMDGKSVISKPNSLIRDNEFQIDLGTLPDGVYLLKIEVDDGIIIKKIIKN